MSPEQKNFDAAALGEPSLAPFAAFIGSALAFIVAAGLCVAGLISIWWLAAWMALFVGCWCWARWTRVGFEARRDEQVRERCARDSDWCDGHVCRERGIECPNAEPGPPR